MNEIRVYFFDMSRNRNVIESYTKKECEENCVDSLSLSEFENDWNDSEEKRNFLSMSDTWIRII